MTNINNPDIERLEKIRMHCFNIQKTLQNINLEVFTSENGVDIRDSSSFRLFQIGEHSNKLSKDFKERYPDFKWAAIYRFRNILGHDYESVSHKAIWKTCKNDIPKLLNYVDKIINDIEKTQQSEKEQEVRSEEGEGDF
ncbi:MAG: DUF86 domain-containing protein [Defluviitaleaceae bacterium]|nr:DUF86 domain-containing protein [Defluviitaleaceae bacterium]